MVFRYKKKKTQKYWKNERKIKIIIKKKLHPALKWNEKRKFVKIEKFSKNEPKGNDGWRNYREKCLKNEWKAKKMQDEVE